MWFESLSIQDTESATGSRSYSFDRGCTVVSGSGGSTDQEVASLLLGTLLGCESPEGADPARITGAELRIRVGGDTFVVRRSFKDSTVTLLDGSETVLFESENGTADLDGYRSRLSELLGLEDGFWKAHEERRKRGSAISTLDMLSQRLHRAEQLFLDREEVLQNLVRFEHLSRERIRLENSLVELRDERDRTRKYVEAQEQAKSRLTRDYPAFLEASSDLQAEIQGWIDASHRLASVQRDKDRIDEAVKRLAPGRIIQKGGIAAIVLGVLSWLICQGSGAPVLGLMLFPFFSVMGFAMVWYMDRSVERVRVSHESEWRRIEKELVMAVRVAEETHDRLGSLGIYESPEEIRQAFRGYMEIQEKLERARNLASTYRPLGEVQNDYEQVFSELQVLDTQTRDLVAQARYLSGMDASPQILHEKIDKARQEGAEAKTQMDRLGPEVERLRAESGGASDDGPIEAAMQALREAVKMNGQRVLPLVLDESFEGWNDGQVDEARDSILELVKAGGQAILISDDSRIQSWNGEDREAA